VDDLTVTLPSHTGVRAPVVDGVSFRLGVGEMLGVVGESGCGKSMMVRSLLDIAPTAAQITGHVQFGGVDIRALDPRRRRQHIGRDIGMILQDPATALNPVRTIFRQLRDPMRFHLGVSSADARVRAIELLELVGVVEPVRRLDQYPHELSGGMRQRICIALALSLEPKVLIADEPTTALDVTIQRQILDLLTSIQRELEMSIILITHDLGILAGRANRIAVMYAGQIVEQGPAIGILRGARHRYTEALLAARIAPETPRDEPLHPIPGRPPAVDELGGGCRFAPRCTASTARCIDERPVTVVDAHGHGFACHHPAELVDDRQRGGV
jgi:oligopeptide/dipeptide ABC transporter ATP-binding protein